MLCVDLPMLDLLCQGRPNTCTSEMTARCRCAQALGRRGVDVAYVGGSSSVLAVGGSCARGNVAIWDTLAPPAGGPVAALCAHTALVTALQVCLPGPQATSSSWFCEAYSAARACCCRACSRA